MPGLLRAKKSPVPGLNELDCVVITPDQKNDALLDRSRHSIPSNLVICQGLGQGRYH